MGSALRLSNTVPPSTLSAEAAPESAECRNRRAGGPRSFVAIQRDVLDAQVPQGQIVPLPGFVAG